MTTLPETVKNITELIYLLPWTRVWSARVPRAGAFTLFFCHQKKSVQKKSARLLFRPPAPLRFSTDAGAAELGACGRLSAALFPTSLSGCGIKGILPLTSSPLFRVCLRCSAKQRAGFTYNGYP